jgi:hypothetical protein
MTFTFPIDVTVSDTGSFEIDGMPFKTTQLYDARYNMTLKQYMKVGIKREYDVLQHLIPLNVSNL